MFKKVFGGLAFLFIVLIGSSLVKIKQRELHPVPTVPAPVIATLPMSGPDGPLDAMIEYPQPYVYEQWWRETMKCTNIFVPKKYRDAVKFSYVNADAMRFANPYSITSFVGYTFVPQNRIVVVRNVVSDPDVVRHEMVHWLLFQTGKPNGHPDADPYLWKCNIPVIFFR